MTLQQELASWNPFERGSQTVHDVPAVGSDAPSTAELHFPRPTVIAFLRHCGCPFAEKRFRSVRDAAADHPSIHFVAISHSDEDATNRWVAQLGGPGQLAVIADHERQIYRQYGLGVSSFWHTLNPWSLWSVVRLGRQEQIWNRPTESGSRWQTAGLFAVQAGQIAYAHVAQAAEDLGDLDVALRSLQT